MFKKLTNIMIKFRWAVVAFWLVATVLVILTAPKLSDILRTDSGSFLPEDSKAAQATKLIESVFPENSGHTSLVLVISSENKLTKADEAYITRLGQYFTAEEKKLTLGKVTTPYDSEALKDQLVSKDGKVALLYLNVNAAGYTDITTETVSAVRAATQKGIVTINGTQYSKPSGLDIYLTGDSAIAADQHATTNQSMDVITKITIGLLLVILLIIYRSPIAALTPLAAIGISFVVSRGVIGYLTNWGFKISSFTETFLLAVLFGAGTDYCMLLFSRYKEELAHGKDKRQALIDALPGTTEAILSSGGTVILGFLFMVFASFGLYNTTGPSVAIGVGITLLAVLTLIPALVAILGKSLFWPIRNFAQHKERLEGGFWAKLAQQVARKPLRYLLATLVILVPLAVYSGHAVTSYDSMKDMPSDTDSIKGFTVMSEHFHKGDLLPVTITLKTNKNLWDSANLKAMDALTDNLMKLDNVQVVRCATRPLGEKLTQASLGNQVSLLSGGLKEVKNGFAPIKNGMTTIQKNIDKIEAGISKAASGLKGDMAGSLGELENGVSQTQNGVGQLGEGVSQSAAGIKEINTQLASLSDGLAQTKTGVQQLSAALGTAKASLDNLVKSQPTLQMNADFQTAYGTIQGVLSNLSKLEQSVAQMQSGVSAVRTGLGTIASGLDSLGNGASQAKAALAQIKTGLSAMKSGAADAGTQLQTAANGMKSISGGIDPLVSGLGNLQSGLSQITDSTSGFSSELQDVFYLPSDVFKQYPEFKDAVSQYLSANGHGATFNVVLSVTPYSTAALDSADAIRDTVAFSLKNTSLKDASFAVSGVSATFAEIRDIVKDDFNLVIALVLLGIFIVLALLLRSVVAPVYLLLTTVLSYLTTLGISDLVLCKLLGQDGLHWSVPFFSFCVLVALGVDYNIFLMTRVKEEYIPGQMRATVTKALSTTGGIITSCGIIMAGTFGSMIFSPLRPMMQIGFAACVGIILDTFLIRSVVVPSLAVFFGETNWWPGRRLAVSSAARVWKTRRTK